MKNFKLDTILYIHKLNYPYFHPSDSEIPTQKKQKISHSHINCRLVEYITRKPLDKIARLGCRVKNTQIGSEHLSYYRFL